MIFTIITDSCTAERERVSEGSRNFRFRSFLFCLLPCVAPFCWVFKKSVRRTFGSRGRTSEQSKSSLSIQANYASPSNSDSRVYDVIKAKRASISSAIIHTEVHGLGKLQRFSPRLHSINFYDALLAGSCRVTFTHLFMVFWLVQRRASLQLWLFIISILDNKIVFKTFRPDVLMRNQHHPTNGK